MVSTQNAKRKIIEVRLHVYSMPLPDGCFVMAEEGVFVASPEFCFLLMARELELIQLIELGYEFCGTYSLADDGSTSTNQTEEKSTRQLPMLTNLKRLTFFISRMQGVAGRNKAMRALRYIAERSASPMETKLAMLMTLPCILGGYCLPRPELNGKVIPSKAVRKSLSQNYFYCDLYWRVPNVAVEYDSDEYHANSAHIAKDAIKRNALALCDTFVITMTRRQVYSTIELERAASLVAKSIGFRMRYRDYPKFDTAHYKLRKMLLFPTISDDYYQEDMP